MTGDTEPADNDEPFATYADLEQRWRTLTDGERVLAETLLGDASQMIRDTCPGWESASPLTRKAVACAMVKRSMLAGDLPGVTQSSETVGSFTQSMSYANPAGDMYLTKQERRRIGGSGQRMWIVDMQDGHRVM